MGRRSRQEQALVVLISEPSIAKAAEASGISQPTLFRYLRDPSFRKQYREAKRSLLEGALGDLQKATGRAVAVLSEIMEDTEATPGARVSAAKAVLAFSIQVGQLEDILERLEKVEEATWAKRERRETDIEKRFKESTEKN